jgi:hypothetical protein
MLERKQFVDVETIEHGAVEWLLVIPKSEFRCFSTGRNSATSVYMLKEPTLKGINLPSL